MRRNWLIEQLKPGEEVEITKDERTVAMLAGPRRQRQFGLGQGKHRVLQENDKHLEDFKE